MPSLEQQEALRAWVEGGGRWVALHGTNSILRFLDDGLVDSPAWAPHLMETLGTQFIAHPPIAPYRVEVADPQHPLVRGIEPFETTDELYLIDTHADLHVLLDTEFEGAATGFVRDRWPHARHPVMYLRDAGAGRRALPDPRSLPRPLRPAAADGLLAQRRSLRLEPAGVLRAAAARSGVGQDPCIRTHSGVMRH